MVLTMIDGQERLRFPQLEGEGINRERVRLYQLLKATVASNVMCIINSDRHLGGSTPKIEAMVD